MQLLVVPRWGGTGTSDFYPWLAEQVAPWGVRCAAAALRPTPDAPEPDATIAEVRRALIDPASTIVVAHSVGCRAALAVARALDTPLRGLVCVAGWFTVDRPWPSILPWLADDLVGAPAARAFEVLISDDDPFTADHATTRARFEAIGATVHLVPGARHFNAATEPAVLAAVARVLGRHARVG